MRRLASIFANRRIIMNLEQFAKLMINGADRDRTGNPRVANAVLSQLSYGPQALHRIGNECGGQYGGFSSKSAVHARSG